MRYTIASLAVAAIAANANPMPQVTSAVTPPMAAPSGCMSSYDGDFEIQVVNVSSSSTKRDLGKRAHALVITLSDGKLMDSEGRTGYVAANSQFQFDSPPQTGAKYTAGFSVCQNGSLAIGADAVWYQCLSGDFYNLYDQNDAGQCNPVYINVLKNGDVNGYQGVASQTADGQVTAQATSPVSQITDGQVQATTAGAVSQITDGQVQATTAAAVSQISDGQVQATSAAAVSQISDGQVQATTAAGAVSQISDGQVQATTAAPVSQITDGQVQAPTSGAVSQISDGQIQASAGSNGTIASPTASVVPYTGAASSTTIGGQFFGLVAAVLGVAML